MLSAAFVQTQKATSAAALSVAPVFSPNNVVSNSLIAFASWGNTANFTSLADSAGNVWVQIGGEFAPASPAIKMRAFYCASCVGGANTVTLTVSGSVQIWLEIREYSNVGALDTGFGTAGLLTNAAASGTAVTTGNGTTAEVGETVMASGPTVSAAANVTNGSLQANSYLRQQALYIGLDRLGVPQGTNSLTCTLSLSSSWAVVAIAFKRATVPFWAFVKATPPHTQTTNPTTLLFTGPNIAGNLIFVYVWLHITTVDFGVLSITDTQGNTYTRIATGFASDGNNNAWHQVYVATALGGVGNNTVSIPGQFNAIAVEYSGLNPVGIPDATVITSTFSVAITASKGGSLILMFGGFGGGGTGWTSANGTTRTSSANNTQTIALDVTSSAGSNTPLISNNSGGGNAHVLVVVNVAAVAFDKSYSIDAYVQGLTDKSYSNDAVVQVDKLLSFLIDALVQIQSDKSYSNDALVQIQTDKSYLNDAVVQVDTSKSYSIDVVVQTTSDKSYLIDALVQIQSDKSYSNDAVVQVDKLLSFLIDAIVQLIVDHSFLNDAIVLVDQSEPYSNDAVVIIDEDASYGNDAQVSLSGGSLPYSVDAFVNLDFTPTYSVDAVVFIINVDGIIFLDVEVDRISYASLQIL